MINYNIIYSKMVYKYSFKIFYNSRNKKKYKSQIQQYNMQHTNSMIIKDIIILKKAKKKVKLTKSLLNNYIGKISLNIKVYPFAKKYRQAISKTDINKTIEIRLIGIKKY